MANYKVLQDIEAEDKFLGPLTLKQCIFAAIAIVGGYLSYILISRGIWVIAMPLFPVIIVTGFLAFPWGRDQPTEVWLLAKLRFMFKPRKRVWDQSGVQEIVHITAPPSVEQFTGDNLTQNEVKSRLKALADTIDSRGWAIKGTSGQPLTMDDSSSDRLVGPSILPSVSRGSGDLQETDIFDSALATDISSKISASSSQHRQEAVSTMQQSAQGQASSDNFWFMHQPAAANGLASFSTQSQTMQVSEDNLSPLFSNKQEQTSPDEALLLNSIKQHKELEHQDFRNHKTIVPTDPNRPTPPVTPPTAPATINLARNNDDRTIDSLAREAGGDEVVVPLH